MGEFPLGPPGLYSCSPSCLCQPFDSIEASAPELCFSSCVVQGLQPQASLTRPASQNPFYYFVWKADETPPKTKVLSREQGASRRKKLATSEIEESSGKMRKEICLNDLHERFWQSFLRFHALKPRFHALQELQWSDLESQQAAFQLPLLKFS